MEHGARTIQWARLMTLLSPFHDQARTLARAVARSSAEGDDLFQEAVLRALDKLPSLREERKFRGWFYQILLSVHRSRHRRSFWNRFTSLGEVTVPLDAARGDDGSTWEDERVR